MNNDTWMLILLLAVVFGALVATTTFSGRGSLDSIKSKTVGDGAATDEKSGGGFGF